MDTFLQIGLSNALAALGLALPIAMVRYFCRRPAIVHSLWLLVLLKLVTPPIVWAPILPKATPAAEETARNDAPVDPAAAARILQSLPPAIEEPANDTPSTLPASAADMATPEVAWSWQSGAVAVWLGGSVLWLLITLWRIGRFRRWLRHAQPASALLRQQVETLARQMRLRHCPAVYLVPGPLSPMLFALFGRPRLLLPALLWSRLPDEQRQTLLVHELAHYRRRDHWVRLLELVTTGLYWWHPVVWWARHELREAEEECCDAWVVWTLPAAARAYATALMETVEFLAEARPICPPAGSGIGHLHILKRRLTMIMRGTTPRALSWTGLLTVFGLGITLLPWLPTWAQEPPRPVDPPPMADVHQHVAKVLPESCSQCHTAHMPQEKSVMSFHDDMVRLLGQVDRDRRAVADAQKALNDARARLAGSEKELQRALGRFRSATSADKPARSESVPAILCRNPFADLGTVGQGYITTHKFVIINSSPNTVHITDIRSTAGWLSSRAPDKDIQPGSQSVILATVDTRRIAGDKVAHLFVMFNGPKPTSLQLALKVHVVASDATMRRDSPKIETDAKDKFQRQLQDMQKQLDELRKEIKSRRQQPLSAAPPITGPIEGQTIVPDPTPARPPRYSIAPPNGQKRPPNPYDDKYYAPTIPLKPQDAKVKPVDPLVK